jgi:hypothetical protein
MAYFTRRVDDMPLAKTLVTSFLLTLVVGVFVGTVIIRQAVSSATGEVIKDDGCVRQGVEAGCLILKTFDEKKTYALFFADGKRPEVGAAISFEGVKHDEPTTCMQGIAVDVKKWTSIKRLCPRETVKATESTMATEEKNLVDVRDVTVQEVNGNLFRIVAKGTVPTSGWVVNLHPVIYIRPPETWEIDAIGIKPTEIVSPVITPWDASIEMRFSKETKNVAVKGLNGAIKKPIPW